MNKKLNIIAAIGLLIGIIFGQLGMFIPDYSVILYEISSLGLIPATALLTVKYLRADRDLVATGFLVFTIGEAVMTAGNALGWEGGLPAFGAGIAMYVPAFWLIGLPAGMPKWTRFTIVAASIPFLAGAFQIFMGEKINTESPFIGAGYGLMTISIIGWVIHLFREK